MKNTTKFGAVLIGLMFLLSLIAAVPVQAATIHNVAIVPASTTSEYADWVKIYDSSNSLVGNAAADSSSHDAWFGLPHGDYTAKIFNSGILKAEFDFTVKDGASTTFYYNIGTVTNNAPIAKFTHTESELTVSVDASTSSDPDAGDTIIAYRWDFGDGLGSSLKTTNHTYAAAGTYTITLTVTDSHSATDTETATITFEVNTTGDLIVKDLNFDDEVAPSTAVDFDLELKNNATYDAENVLATIIIKGIAADKDNLETEIDFGDIDTGDRQTESVTITIPQDADDKSYDVVVDLEWEDADGNKYTGSYAAPDQITVEKVKHQISITNVQMDEAKYLPEDTAQVAISVLDTGANDETVYVKATSDIGVLTKSASFKLKEGDASTQYLSFIVPKDTKAGKYFVVVSAVYGSYTASKSIVLEIASTEAPTTVTVVTDETGTNGTGLGIPATSIALAVVIILLIGAIAWMGKDFIAPKPQAIKSIAATRSKVFK